MKRDHIADTAYDMNERYTSGALQRYPFMFRRCFFTL